MAESGQGNQSTIAGRQAFLHCPAIVGIKPGLAGNGRAIVNSCGLTVLGSGCDVLLDVGVGCGPFLELAVGEGGAGSDGGDEVWCVDAAPAVLGGVEEFVGHGQSCFA